ncbi:MAG: sodium-dependent transporter [Bacillota bacterium]|uniref:sodium-dependent transporter n=1 Tax=Desulfurispora thermophila TaxID=265470 RepID=UPI00036EB4E6|nr:sodium-dependent transporter [Desulfurispora thermophila]
MAKYSEIQPQTKQAPPREGFTSTLGVIAATLGSAVGLGNIWKFPYMTGQNGGAAFLFIYIVCVTVVGLTIMISEFIIGRHAGAATVGAYKKLAPGSKWYLAGTSNILAAFLIMAFYTTVAGWVYAYAFQAMTGSLSFSRPEDYKLAFASFTGDPWLPLFWQWIALAVTGAVILAGVKNGIERITKTLLPVLFVLLLLCDVRALTLDGASAGLAFLFKPDFSKITGVTILLALGLSFFKLSVGMGTMTTYGSYIDKNQNLISTAAKVMFSDTLVSILAGIAIFPAVFAFGFQPDAGPSLLFLTIPMVFSSMPLGQLFLAMFFVLTAIAATGAMISLLEVPVSYLCEERKWPRWQATAASVLGIALLGSTATLSTSTLSNFTLFGKTMFDLFDFASSNILLPAGGIAIAIFVSRVLSTKVIFAEATNNGQLKNHRLVTAYYFSVRYLAPIAIAIILLNSLGLVKL